MYRELFSPSHEIFITFFMVVVVYYYYYDYYYKLNK